MRIPSDRSMWVTAGVVAGALAYDLYELWRLRKLDREVWKLADNSAMGPLHDADSQRTGDVPPVSPVASDEVAKPDSLGDNAGSGD